jgi:nitrite reductase (NADH) small subunit
MQIVTLSLNAFNAISIGETQYFTLPGDRHVVVAPSACPHRGGPLNLSRRSDCGKRLVCPWHDNAYPIKIISRAALPAVTRGKQVSIVASEGPVRVWKEARFLDLCRHHSNEGTAQ